MPIDFRASQIQTNKIIASGSTGTETGAQIVVYSHLADDGTAPNQGFINQSTFVTSSIGTDIFLYVSGGIGQRNVGNAKSISCFGGDVHISGNLTVDGTYPSGGGTGTNFFWSPSNAVIEASGSLTITGSGYFKNGLSGSLQAVAPGVPYLLAGPNITIATNSLGQVSITGSASGGGGSSFYRLEVLDYYSTNATTDTVAGQVIFPAHQFTGSIVLYGIIANTSPTATGSVRLYNVTSGSYVEIGGVGNEYLFVSGTTPTIVTSVNLISASNFNSSSQAIYELQVSSSNGASYGMFGGFELRPSGSFTGVTYSTSSTYYTYVSGTWEDGGDKLATTSSVAIAGNLGTGYFADAVGTDVYFFVSGSSGSKDGGTPGVAVFGGDVVISGVLHGGSPLKIGTQTYINGGLTVTGSLINGNTNNVASGLNSHAEGSATQATYTGAHAEGATTLASANFSHAEGDSTITYGIAAHAEGQSTTASGQYSHAEGNGAQSAGSHSHAEGRLTQANGQESHAEGEETVAGGRASHAEGYQTQATAFYTHSEGASTVASATGAHSEGQSTSASGQYSHAEGTTNTASGYAAHAEGGGTIASGAVSHAEGADTVAQGDRSHAEGQYTLAFGVGSHSEGYYTTGSGDYSHAEGYLTVASGTYSHAGGIGTIASGSGQTVIGSYNLEGNTDSLFVIGDGKFVITQAYRGDIVRVNKGSNPGYGIVEVTGSLSVSGSGGSNGTLNQYSGLRYYPTIVTSLPYTASLNDYIIAVSASAGPGVELPASEFGRTFIVKDVSGSAASDLITITAAGGELIDGSPAATIGIDNGSYKFVYFGSGIGWGIV